MHRLSLTSLLSLTVLFLLALLLLTLFHQAIAPRTCWPTATFVMRGDNQEIILGPETELRIGDVVYRNFVNTRKIFVSTKLIRDDWTIYAPSGSSIVVYSCHV